jgi:hypothetical protein
MLIRSMGPISELDMVSTRQVHYRANITAGYGQYKVGSLYSQNHSWIWSVQGRFIIQPASQLDMVSTRPVHYTANITAGYGQYNRRSVGTLW